jgi:hypothetical protein
MMNLQELHAVQGVLHYLDKNVPKDLDIDFDVTIGDSNGDTLGRIARVGGDEYQFLGPDEVRA